MLFSSIPFLYYFLPLVLACLLYTSPECPALAELCRRLRASREERKYRIAAFLRGKGLDVPLEEVEALAGGGVVARPHFARVMLRRGYVSSLREAFDRYLDTDEYQRIERWKAGAPECIAAIHDAGGKAVLEMCIRDRSVEGMQGFHTGPLRADLVGRRSQFALIPLVEGVVGVVAGGFALKLELLLIAEMLADIAVQKLHGFIDLGASGPCLLYTSG